MARKRASMREGPLADLFRSTDESVDPEDVKVTATNGGRATRVEVADEEPPTKPKRAGKKQKRRSKKPRQETPEPAPVPEPIPEPTPDPVPEPIPGPAEPEPVPPEPVAEAEIMLDPA